MNPRMLILLVVALALAIFFAAAKSRPKSALPEIESDVTEEITERQNTLDQFDLPGEEPAEDPDLSVQVEVDRSKGKNRLYFTISEAHGFYVEQFNVRFWYVSDGKEDLEDSPLVLGARFERYLPAKENLRVCLELVPAELARINGDMGETRNWKAEIDWYGRAREKNPERFPPRVDIVGICD